MSRPQLRCAYEASDAVWEAAEALEPDRKALAALQQAHGIDAPLDMDLRLAGVDRQSYQFKSLHRIAHQDSDGMAPARRRSSCVSFVAVASSKGTARGRGSRRCGDNMIVERFANVT